MGLLKDYRLRAGLTQVDVAKVFHINQVSVHQWESGQAAPSIDKVPRLARLYGCSLEQIHRAFADAKRERMVANGRKAVKSSTRSAGHAGRGD